MKLPDHIAIIMDGNGRWAEQRGLPRSEGHREGAEAVRRVVRACRKLGIRGLTLYAFSEQNWQRPDNEISSLMRLLLDFLVSEREELLGKEIRLRAIGRLDKLPESVRKILQSLVKETERHEEMSLCLALSYGGREEIVDACREVADRVRRGEMDAAQIDVESLAGALPSMDLGPVDLLIRTGGEQRLSNFLLWGAAYAEFHFTDRLWPEYSEDDLHAALSEFSGRERRFGQVDHLPDTAVGS